MAQVWTTFDDWTLTSCGQRDGMLQLGILSHDCDTATGLTAATGNLAQSGSVVSHWGAAAARTRVDRLSVSDGLVRFRGFVPYEYGGPYVRGADATDRDNYAGLIRNDTNQLAIFRMDDGGFTQIGVAAFAYDGGAPVEGYFSLNGGNVSLRDTTNAITVGPIADATYATGNVGVVSTNAAGGNAGFVCDWIGIENSALSATAVSTTFDAGSAIGLDGLAWDESLNGGNVTFDVSGVASGSPNYLETGLTNPRGSVFSATQTFRYWHVRANLTRTATSQNAGVLRGSVRLFKGNDAGGGGGNDTGGGGIFGRRRRRTRVVVLTEAQAKKLLRPT